MYQRPAGVSSSEYEEIKKRQAMNRPGQSNYYYDDGTPAAGVSSAEYQEIKRRQQMNRPQKIDYSAQGRGVPQPGYGAHGPQGGQPPKGAEVPKRGNDAPFRPGGAAPGGPGVNRPQPKRGAGGIMESNESYGVAGALGQNYSQDPNRNPGYQDKPFPQPGAHGPQPKRGAGGIMESNESYGVAGVLGQNYSQDASKNYANYHQNQPFPQPGAHGPQPKRGAGGIYESNESYGVAGALGHNFAQGQRADYQSDLMPSTGPMSYKIGAGNMSSGVGGAFGH